MEYAAKPNHTRLYDLWAEAFSETRLLARHFFLDDYVNHLPTTNERAFSALWARDARPRILIVGQNPSHVSASLKATGIPFCATPGDLEYLLANPEEADLSSEPKSIFWQWTANYPWFFDHFLVWNFLPQVLAHSGQDFPLREVSTAADAYDWTVRICARHLEATLDAYPSVTRVVLLGADFERPVKKLCERRRLTFGRAPHPLSSQRRSGRGKRWADIMTRLCK